ncbi:bifunctional tetrahydrofolate synthase/dihydrofolate synthase [Candidatus Sororendozoicomonas aggregata]|uniref:bifunctional tetrahydrofolate synthase/dihydrofolate synthase n=1 Tax=Candidatus Sororendozoicomonas aggregata TaxID=3073239 RepID=UPI002ED4670C
MSNVVPAEGFSALSQWLRWLENTHPEQEMDFGLDRIRVIAEVMGLLRPSPFVITVAGTNGKGSTAAILEAILRANGHTVGVFTSPHFLRFNERIRVNGEAVADQPICEAFNAIHACRGATVLTYFENAFLAALYCFALQPLDYLILEVGLGGRLDAVNVIDPDVSVMTTIGLDHQDYLGYSLEAIGKEKAGIMREGRPTIYGDQSMPFSVLEKSLAVKAPLFRRGHEFRVEQKGEQWFWSGQSAEGGRIEHNGLPLPALELDNAATALQALQFLPMPVTRTSIEAGLKAVTLVGRAQRLQWRNASGQLIDVLLDVSHNPQAVERLANQLKRADVTGKIHAVWAMYSDKDHVSVIDLLSAQIHRWTIAALDSPRGLSVAALGGALSRAQALINTASDVVSGFHQAVNEAEPGDLVLVGGSFMTVAAVMSLVEKN